MLKQMPGTAIGELARKALEEVFEGRNDKEYARICVEEDISDIMNDWERLIGIKSSSVVTSTEDGFRVVIVALKKFNHV